MDNFMPHGFCLQWNPQLVGLLVVSNLLTALSYYSIPSNLLYIAAKKNVRFGWILVLFATFIVLCGTTHIMSIVTIWNGNYWLEATINALTAAISLVTAVALWILIPQVFAALDTDAGRRVIRTEKNKTRTQMITSLVLGMLAIVFVGGLLYQQSLGLIESRMQFQQLHDQVEVKLKALDSTVKPPASVAVKPETSHAPGTASSTVSSSPYSVGSIATSGGNSAHSVIQSVLELEDQFMKSNNSELNTKTRWYLLTFVVLAILAIGLFCSFGYFMSKYLTDIAAANRAVRESEELLRLTFASVKDFAIINLDAAGKIIAWNSAAQRLHGYEENEIIGKHFSTLYFNDGDAGKSKNGTENDIRNGVTNGALEAGPLQDSLALVTSQGGVEAERWQVRKDHSKFWADVALSPIYDEHKDLTGYVQITRDVTERRRAQDEINEQADQLKELTQKLVTSNQDLQQLPM